MKKPSHISIHEVGHALVAYALRERMVEIIKRDDKSGCCVLFHKKNKRGLRDKVKMSAVMTAGHLAEVVFCNKDIRKCPREDYKALERIGTTIAGANIIKNDLKAFLKGNKNTVFHLARMLDEKNRIGRNTFHRELRKLGWKK